MCYYFIDIGFETLRLDWDAVGIVRFDGFLLNISSSTLPSIAHADLLEGEVAVVELVTDEDGGVEGDGHVDELE